MDGGGSSWGERPRATVRTWVCSGALGRPAHPTGVCTTPYLFQLTKQSVWMVRCCREAGSSLGSLVSQPTSLPPGHEAHVP